MNAATEAYERLMHAQANRPSELVMQAWREERERRDENTKIRRRLPKVA